MHMHMRETHTHTSTYYTCETTGTHTLYDDITRYPIDNQFNVMSIRLNYKFIVGGITERCWNLECNYHTSCHVIQHIICQLILGFGLGL